MSFVGRKIRSYFEGESSATSDPLADSGAPRLLSRGNVRSPIEDNGDRSRTGASRFERFQEQKFLAVGRGTVLVGDRADRDSGLKQNFGYTTLQRSAAFNVHGHQLAVETEIEHFASVFAPACLCATGIRYLS